MTTVSTKPQAHRLSAAEKRGWVAGWRGPTRTITSGSARSSRCGRLIPFLGAGANLCDRGDGAVGGVGPFLPSARSSPSTSPTRGRYPDPGTPTCCACPSTSRGAAARTSSTRTCARSSTPSTRRLAPPAARARCRRARARRAAAAARGDDELRRPGRAGVRGRMIGFDVVWYEAKQNGRDRPLRAPSAGREAEGRSRVRTSTRASPIMLERPAILKLHGASTAQRRRRQLRHHRGQLHRLSRGRRRGRADPDRAVAADDEQQLPVPRLLAERLEPARDPNRLWGARKLGGSRGRCSGSRPTRTEQDRAGALGPARERRRSSTAS